MACSPADLRAPGFYKGSVKSTRIERTANCPHCLSDFTTDFAAQVYCGDKCTTGASNRAQVVRERNRERAALTCPTCRVEFQPPFPFHSKRRYCSKKCARLQESRRRTGDTYRRRAEKFGCRFEEVDRLSIFERDGWRCRGCGSPTPKALSGTTDRLAPELDHIVALSRGGAHSEDNVQLLCKGCNTAKSNHAPDAWQARA